MSLLYTTSVMLNLKAEKREDFGKKLKKAREAGSLPVIVYGRKEEAGAYFVDLKEFNKIYKEAGESAVVELKTADGDKDILIYDVAYHPVTGVPVHADFYVVEKGKKVEVDVPIIFEGESPAVKGLNGILVKVMHELSVEAMPKDLPHDIKVDISVLVDFDSQILVKDIKLPSGVVCLADAEEPVALVSEPKEEEEEEVEVADISKIEVEKKGNYGKEPRAMGEVIDTGRGELTALQVESYDEQRQGNEKGAGVLLWV